MDPKSLKVLKNFQLYILEFRSGVSDWSLLWTVVQNDALVWSIFPRSHTFRFPFYCCCTVVASNVGVARRFRRRSRFYQQLCPPPRRCRGVILYSFPDSSLRSTNTKNEGKQAVSVNDGRVGDWKLEKHFISSSHIGYIFISSWIPNLYLIYFRITENVV